MKKTIAMCAMMLNCILSTWGVELTAPTYPSWVTPESGGVYFLYNVEADAWMTNSSKTTSYVGVGSVGLPVQLTYNEDESWFMAFKDFTTDGKYGWVYSSSATYASINKSLTYSNNPGKWSISGTDGIYQIQRNIKNKSYYNADEWLGWVGESSDYVYANRTLGENTSWKFATAADGERYCAENALYKALKYAETYQEAQGNIDFYVNDFLTMYSNRAEKTPAELTEAATQLTHTLDVSNSYEAPSWNEYPICWSSPNGAIDFDLIRDSRNGFKKYLNSGSSAELCATVVVDELSTFVYSLHLYFSNYGSGHRNAVLTCEIYVDGRVVRTLKDAQAVEGVYTNRFSEVLVPGKHTISWKLSKAVSTECSLSVKDVGVTKSPLISVDLCEPGSLGTEVLYNTDHLKNVRRLKVKGAMNQDDWNKIRMMTGLLDLDLSEASFKEIPAYQFQVSDGYMEFMHRLVLPEGVEKINKCAFQGSLIDTLALPSTLKNIGNEAFRFSHIQEIIMPDDCTEIGSEGTECRTFGDMAWLKKVVCAKNWKAIHPETFYCCDWLEELKLPEKLESIGYYAFKSNYHLKNLEFPEGLKSIGWRAFYDCKYATFGAFPESLERISELAFCDCFGITKLIVPEGVSYIETRAFDGCDNIKYAELSINQLAGGLFLGVSPDTLRLNSPTIPTRATSGGYSGYVVENIGKVNLIVPSFLVNAYKLDDYWYNCKSITGFDPSEIDHWTIENSLVLNRERMTGTPSIFIGANGSLKINGTDSMPIQDLTFWSNRNGYYGRIFSNADGVTVGGDLTIEYYTHTKQQWRFVSLPFNMKVGDITSNNAEAIYSIAYYDGASRAEYGATGSWKKYQAEDVIPAGTGFIFCSNKDKVTWYFHALDDESKQNATSIHEFQKTLEVNEAENKSNRGWNLIGNPYQCFYNNHCLNFTAPITVWNPDSRNYVAYSLTDDDYAICPNEAFFVQCPSEEYKIISFPLQGRQMTDVVESQNAVKAEAPSASRRKLINIQLVAEDEGSDQTRIVLNEMASVEYEISCDAGKFLSMDGSVPQLFTLDAEGTQYAINERPMGEGKVQLGFSVAKDGTYTIRLSRCDDTRVMLTDNTTGTITEITDGEYRFEANAGTDNDRFEISFLNEKETGISGIKDTPKDENVIYNLSGQRVNVAKEGDIYIQNGKKLLK